MSYFLFSGNLTIGQKFEMDEGEAVHLLARRTRLGESLNVQGNDGKRMQCAVVEVKKKQIICKALSRLAVPPEPQTKILLFQSMVQEQALDFILQKSTELGAQKITLFNSERTATRLSWERFGQKQARWQKILWEAAKQCDRQKIPALEYSEGLDEVVKELLSLEKILIFDIVGKKLNAVNPPPARIGIVIGPEGGLTQTELGELIKLPNAEVANLGPLLLRAETASLAALAITRNFFY